MQISSHCIALGYISKVLGEELSACVSDIMQGIHHHFQWPGTSQQQSGEKEIWALGKEALKRLEMKLCGASVIDKPGIWQKSEQTSLKWMSFYGENEGLIRSGSGIELVRTNS